MAVAKIIVFLVHAVLQALVSALMAVAAHMLVYLTVLLAIGLAGFAVVSAFGIGSVGLVLRRGKRKREKAAH